MVMQSPTVISVKGETSKNTCRRVLIDITIGQREISEVSFTGKLLQTGIISSVNQLGLNTRLANRVCRWPTISKS